MTVNEDTQNPHPKPLTPSKPPTNRPPSKPRDMTAAEYDLAVLELGVRVADALWEENTGTDGDRAAVITARAAQAVKLTPAAA